MEEHKNQSRGLLEYLASHTGCMYISDLRCPDHTAKLKEILPEVPLMDYSAWEWNDAVFYITGEKRSFQTQKEAQEHLCQYLEQGVAEEAK
ncbi:hypothetical protein H9X85_09065 [Anaerotignum lactatifermentans]|uniref:Uncharacterized protein n=1 Tax=Anaerotignum lactatifermentans TaxID=160404 RepID=A0ABS2G9Y9_9FIRM|nr:hypothetical protein [Anaerotignum lactatifermentans]MBM6829786.1 hypothetical protein [Anaerotignum lactatifermentans]MBM6878274.1 hypothetical protein [Anaerotignum lactatifermentans]MBM6951354.1 hypothetical protein [Anaerotignum lactatifermentans]